jgi:uncharacterized protein (DUF1800 family)
MQLSPLSPVSRIVTRTRAAEALCMATDWVVPMLSRATYGPTPYTVSLAKQAGTQAAWLEQQLNPAKIADPEGDDVRRLYPELGWSIAQARANLDDFSWDGMFALGQATLSLATWSRRQLFEKMVELWSNHLNVTNPSDSVWDSRMSYDHNVIRPYALGRFSDMLVASATHPAMLTYLNNADSTKEHPNENYGRELLELHTVGVNGGYTETDVINSARIMTGWTVDDATGQAVYRPQDHWTGPVKVLGFSHPNSSPDGRAVVTAYLRYLAMHPMTAKRISRKLCTKLVGDSFPTSFMDGLAGYYLRAGSDIRPVIRRLFATNEWRAGVKLKTPYEDVVSTMRVLGVKLQPTTKSATVRRSGPQAVYWRLQDLRNAPLAWEPPNGYPDVATAWQAADIALGRWNTHQALAAAWWPNRDMLSIPQARLMLPGTLPATYGGMVDALCDRLLFRRLDSAGKTAVLIFMGASPNKPLPKDSEWVTWRLPYVVALILSTPTFASR